MRRMRALLLRLAAPLMRNRRERDLAAEMESHLQLHIDDNLRAGMTPDDARRHARLALGGQEQVKEACREARGVALIDTFAQDVRYAARVLLKARGYSVTAILTLALGIGATTAIFTLANGLLLRPLPVRDPGRLVGIRSGEVAAGASEAERLNAASLLVPVWEQIRDRPQLFERVCASQEARVNLAARGQADFVEGLLASGSFFDTLGIAPIVGRTFTTADDRRGGGPDGPVAVISYGFWQRRFGGAADAIGRQLTINRAAFTIVGVTPPTFFGPILGSSFDVAVPLATAGGEGAMSSVTVIARLRPDQTPESATAALRAAQPQIREAALAAIAARGYPAAVVAQIAKTFLRAPLSVSTPAGGLSIQRVRFERPVLAMLILAALVLLIACANVANLVLGRATARRHEMSVRRALGASRLRLARQVLVESLLLSAAGAALGLVFARGFGPVLVRQASTEVIPMFLDLSLDWRVLAFASAMTVGTALLFGLAPAFRAARVQPTSALKEGGRGHAGQRRWGLNHALVAGQVAFSVILVVAAGLFVRTFATLATMDVGLDRERTVILAMNTQDARVPAADRTSFYERVRQAVATVPGATGAATLLSAPASQDHWPANVQVVGQPRREMTRLGPFLNAVSPGYFATFGTPILSGRGFDDRDGQGAPLVAVVNETFARLFVGGRNPVGETLTFTAGEGEFQASSHGAAAAQSSSPPFQIVGLARDSGSAVNYALRQGIPATVYFSVGQMNPAVTAFAPPPSFRIGVRVANPAAMRELAKAAGRVHPDLRIIVRTVGGYIDKNLVTERLNALLAGFFGLVALMLAGVGIFGVTAYGVTRRRPEIGIRIALGASTAGVIRTVLQGIVVVVAVGLAIGGAISWWLSRLVAALLFGLEPRDPITFAGTAIVLTAVALLAGWLPARRAARIDPAVVLRNE